MLSVEIGIVLSKERYRKKGERDRKEERNETNNSLKNSLLLFYE